MELFVFAVVGGLVWCAACWLLLAVEVRASARAKERRDVALMLVENCGVAEFGIDPITDVAAGRARRGRTQPS